MSESPDDPDKRVRCLILKRLFDLQRSKNAVLTFSEDDVMLVQLRVVMVMVDLTKCKCIRSSESMVSELSTAVPRCNISTHLCGLLRLLVADGYLHKGQLVWAPDDDDNIVYSEGVYRRLCASNWLMQLFKLLPIVYAAGDGEGRNFSLLTLSGFYDEVFRMCERSLGELCQRTILTMSTLIVCSFRSARVPSYAPGAAGIVMPQMQHYSRGTLEKIHTKFCNERLSTIVLDLL